MHPVLRPRSVPIPHLVHVSPGCLSQVAQLLTGEGLDVARVLVGCGGGPSGTHAESVGGDLRAAGIEVVRRPGLTGRLDQAAALAATIIEEGVTTAVAVGGGRVIDTVKLAAARTSVDFVSIPTTIAHDGVSSPVASLAGRDGRRDSHAAAMPIGIIIDVEVIAGAPPRTVRAGVGDLLSNLTAALDWRLAAAGGHAHYDAFSSLIAESAARPLLELPAISSAEHHQLLAEGLLMSGLAMAAAGTSRPCSGSEHLISHALDAQPREAPPLHGEQVALAALVTAAAHGSALLESLRETYARMGLALSPEEAGLSRGELLAAIRMAPSMRPDRWTVLSEPGVVEDAEALMEKAFAPMPGRPRAAGPGASRTSRAGFGVRRLQSSAAR